MFNKISAFLIFHILFSAVSYACFNEFYTLDAKGKSHPYTQGSLKFDVNFNLKKIEQHLRELEHDYKAKPQFEILSDFALNLVKAGKLNEAEIIFRELIQIYPNNYALHANLGTTYELLGKNELALKHIKKSVEINPNAHRGSEWIHIQLLEVKCKLETEPEYLKNRTVLNLSANQEKKVGTLRSLRIQLSERFPFCKGPNDPIMASLVEDLGDCWMEQLSYEQAKALYQIALDYYGGNKHTLSEKINLSRGLRSKYEQVYLPAQRSHSEVSYEKITGVPYRELLNKYNDYSIDWNGITTDPFILLKDLGVIHQATETQQINSNSQIKQKPIIRKTTSSGKVVVTVALVGIVLAGIFIYLYNKRSK